MESKKTRYSDSELKEFKEVILEKLKDARTEFNQLVGSLSPGEKSTDQGDVAAYNTEKEMNHTLVSRTKKLIEQLEAALGRIENKTYGICREKGILIQRERLLAVPHTTLCMEAKLNPRPNKAYAA